MKAAWLNEIGHPLRIEEVERPPLHADGVVIRVLSSHVMSYTGEVFSGDAARMAPPVPYTPGLSAIGRIETVGESVIGLSTGDLVFCGPHVTDRRPGNDPEQILIGWFPLSSGAGHLVSNWKNGSFAEYAAYPATCVTRIHGSLAHRHAELAVLNILTVAYGALVRGHFKPGMTVVINGVTGNIGACTALLALAVGAKGIIGLGRDRACLDELASLHPNIQTVALTGDKERDLEAVRSRGVRTEFGVDASAAVDSMSTEVMLESLCHGATAVWVGGVRADIPVSYGQVVRKELTIAGSYMYDRSCPADLIALIESGRLDLAPIAVHAFPLEQVNDAIALAPTCKGLSSVVVQP